MFIPAFYYHKNGRAGQIDVFKDKSEFIDTCPSMFEALLLVITVIDELMLFDDYFSQKKPNPEIFNEDTGLFEERR